jgi:hypothetical protein
MKSFARQVGPIRLSSIPNELKSPAGFLTFLQQLKNEISRLPCTSCNSNRTNNCTNCMGCTFLYSRHHDKSPSSLAAFPPFRRQYSPCQRLEGLARESPARDIGSLLCIQFVRTRETIILQVLYLTRVRLETGTRRRL